uniref:UDP-glucuronosyltransferase n=1 Tax=Stomoxys calcitrans TaxID=35570 RepID=A0A1I8NYK7_STOCA
MRFGYKQILRLFIVIVGFLHSSHAYHFLAVLHFSSKSHFIVGSALIKGLIDKGHEVTVISPFPQKKPIKNWHDVPVSGVLEFMKNETDDLLNTLERSVMENVVSFHKTGLQVTELVLKSPAVQKLMASNQTFDAVINEVFLSEALYGLSEHFKAPLIGLGTFGAISWNTDMVGSPSPPSYVPSTLLPFTDRMTLGQRIGNLALLTFERLLLDLYYLPKQEKIFRQHFPHSQRSMLEIRKNAALVLLNSHVSLSFPRPYVPNQIEVGGMHINRQRKPLPLDIERFISESPHGVVYFSMGSNIKSKNLPFEKRQELMKALKSLKQRVLWKFEDPHLEGKPDNVYISDWFPQDDILAHDNVKVFITHGGLLSTTESIYHGKPFIGIPIFGDQFLNMAKAEANGYGIMLDYKNLSANALKQAVEKMVYNKEYTNLVKAMSARYKDQPMAPLQKAVYWVEHVARHKGAKYLHCAGLDLNFIQYHNIDAILILYGGILFVLFVVLWLLKCLLGCVFGNKSQSGKTAKKMKKQ